MKRFLKAIKLLVYILNWYIVFINAGSKTIFRGISPAIQNNIDISRHLVSNIEKYQVNET